MALYELDGSRPVLAEGAWVAPSADVIGDVQLGESASVWFGACIRADNGTVVIGARSNVQDGAMGHSDPGVPLVIGEEVTVGHQAILHGCTIGARTLIGMGAIILNRAVIGEDCIVGAGALVTEGKEFPAGSLIVGSPARAVRTLDDTARAGLRMSSAVYVANARRYGKGLKRVD